MRALDSHIRIIEYLPQYHMACESLLVELEKYLISMDEDHLDALGEGYKEKMLDYELNQVAQKNGKCFIAVFNNSVVGLIMGIQREYSLEDSWDYTCPKAGIITELVIAEAYRQNGIGNALMSQMENYFADIGCTYIFVDIFAYNVSAFKFYKAKGFHPRMITAIKEIDQPKC